MTTRPKSPIEVLREAIAEADATNEEWRAIDQWEGPYVESVLLHIDIARRILEALEKQ